MRLAKTDKARAALAARDAGISVLERRILIVSDGLRSDAEIATMLGPTAEPAIDRLLRSGYLQAGSDRREANPPGPALQRTARAAPSAPIASTDSMRGEVQRGTTPAAATATTPARSEPTATADSRRSLVAAKMYMLDILQLQRALDSAALQGALRAARAPDDLLPALLAAMRTLEAVASPSYCERVRGRLAEVLPLEQLPAWLQALAAQPPRDAADAA